MARARVEAVEVTSKLWIARVEVAKMAHRDNNKDFIITRCCLVWRVGEWNQLIIVP